MSGNAGKLYRSTMSYHTSEMLALMDSVSRATGEENVAESLHFTPTALTMIRHVMLSGGLLVTDTQLALSEIDRAMADRLGLKIRCFIDDPEVLKQAEQRRKTRAAVAVDRALALPGPKLIAVGSAPAALERLMNCCQRGEMKDVVVIAAPTGFASVVQMKERIFESGIPAIVVRGKKGGVSVLAAILNGLMEEAERQKTR
ncbi:MAG: precorrin-8X methylmutase [Clostridia bacterium]|nr:precorrin-8X methylmutase [Clostridia bacterium]